MQVEREERSAGRLRPGLGRNAWRAGPVSHQEPEAEAGSAVVGGAGGVSTPARSNRGRSVATVGAGGGGARAGLRAPGTADVCSLEGRWTPEKEQSVFFHTWRTLNEHVRGLGRHCGKHYPTLDPLARALWRDC